MHKFCRLHLFLADEYHDMVGENVPFRTLGFQTLLHLLKSSKDDFDVQGHARDPIIKAHRKEKIYHMQELVRYQVCEGNARTLGCFPMPN